MGLIEDELIEVRKLCEHTIPGSKLVSCVESRVRVEIKQTTFKTIIICTQFPLDYPKSSLLIELKSKRLSTKLLAKLTDVCEKEMKKYIGKPQVMKLLVFVRNFLEENPLCCCYDEIDNLKKLLTVEDEFKLRQKTSSINLKILNNLYYLKAKLQVPDLYPDKCVIVENLESNFPKLFIRYMLAQSKEIARQCVEPPLRKKKANEPPFQPIISLEKVVSFLINCIKQFPNEKCQYCNEICFPSDPSEAIIDENSPKHVERLYCGHLFHNECLITYMRAPPFGNKTCKKCQKKIYHDKWAVADRLAEDRWAHEQARERELAEVTDFFQ